MFDATDERLPAGFTGTSTHAFGLAEAIELARALERAADQVLALAAVPG